MVDICSDFIDEWVKMGLPAKTKVIAEEVAGSADFHGKCERCARVN